MLEGLPAVFFAIVVWKKLPDGPSAAPWLSRSQAQEVQQRSLDVEHAEEEAGGHVDHSLKGVFVDPQIWLAIFVYFCHQISVYTVIFFLPPSIINTYGRSRRYKSGC